MRKIDCGVFVLAMICGAQLAFGSAFCVARDFDATKDKYEQDDEFIEPLWTVQNANESKIVVENIGALKSYLDDCDSCTLVAHYEMQDKVAAHKNYLKALDVLGCISDERSKK